MKQWKQGTNFIPGDVWAWKHLKTGIDIARMNCAKYYGIRNSIQINEITPTMQSSVIREISFSQEGCSLIGSRHLCLKILFKWNISDKQNFQYCGDPMHSETGSSVVVSTLYYLNSKQEQGIYSAISFVKVPKGLRHHFFQLFYHIFQKLGVCTRILSQDNIVHFKNADPLYVTNCS